MQPLVVLRPDDEPQHAFAAEILRSEGVYFFEEASATTTTHDFARWGQASLIVALSGSYDPSVADWLAEYVRTGGNLLALRPEGALADRLGLRVGRAALNCSVRVRPQSGLPQSPEDLLCPGHTSNPLSGHGESLAELMSVQSRSVGDAIVSQRIGEGRSISLGYDLVEVLITLRHGWAGYDQPPGAYYKGPRSIWAFRGLESLYTKQVPIGDVHADVFRALIFELLGPLGVFPRLWHLPQAAKSLFFLKGDGCGEKDADVEIALAERHGAKLTFYRPRQSRYPGDLMHEWAERGHAIAPEFDLTSVTHGVSMTQVTDQVVEQIRAIVEDHGQSLKDECGVDFETVCFHGCQWVGLPQIRLVERNGWQMPTSFISFYPGMQKEGYGIYGITSLMPMRYYDHEGGLCEMMYAPAAWDESQSLGVVGSRGQAGLTTEDRPRKVVPRSPRFFGHLGQFVSGEPPTDMLSHLPIGVWASRPVSLRQSCS